MIDSKQTAHSAGLHYVTDKSPGYRRKKSGTGFTYVDEKTKKKISGKEILQRIRELVIPPAWSNVWICRDNRGHLQVTGYDKRKRKQYRYHPKWNEYRNLTKFTRLREFGECLPSLRKKLEEDLKLPGLPRQKVVAAVVKIMIITQSRVGNSLYAEENDSYGLTTLLNDHADVHGNKVHLAFRGKSGIEHDIEFSDKKLSRIIARCQELPGEELFGYVNDKGETVDISSSHVNDYLKTVTGLDFTAKDIRTWSGTTKALRLLVELGPCSDSHASAWKKRHNSIVKETAQFLRNTVAVCRKYYIHPICFEADEKGTLHVKWKHCRPGVNMNREEKLLLALLEKQKSLAA
ncbi:MAG: DNA topoisomerase IB [Bacteriovoracaceae bacterium]